MAARMARLEMADARALEEQAIRHFAEAHPVLGAADRARRAARHQPDLRQDPLREGEGPAAGGQAAFLYR